MASLSPGLRVMAILGGIIGGGLADKSNERSILVIGFLMSLIFIWNVVVFNYFQFPSSSSHHDHNHHDHQILPVMVALGKFIAILGGIIGAVIGLLLKEIAFGIYNAFFLTILCLLLFFHDPEPEKNGMKMEISYAIFMVLFIGLVTFGKWERGRGMSMTKLLLYSSTATFFITVGVFGEYDFIVLRNQEISEAFGITWLIMSSLCFFLSMWKQGGWITFFENVNLNICSWGRGGGGLGRGRGGGNHGSNGGFFGRKSSYNNNGYSEVGGSTQIPLNTLYGNNNNNNNNNNRYGSTAASNQNHNNNGGLPPQHDEEMMKKLENGGADEKAKRSGVNFYRMAEEQLPNGSKCIEIDPNYIHLKNMIVEIILDLATIFGFQTANCYNQAEHVLMLLINHQRYVNPEDDDLYWPQGQGETKNKKRPPTVIHSLHDKIFANYKEWCKSVGRPKPVFKKINAFNNNNRMNHHQMQQQDDGDDIPPPSSRGLYVDTPESKAKLLDILLYMLMWGEASCVRHMPECLCFLFLKISEEYNAFDEHTPFREYHGKFLDLVITPIYQLAKQGMSRNQGDHEKHQNYDDINEFFWRPECLKYTYSDYNLTRLEKNPEDNSVIKALILSKKQYIEKRSFFTIVLVFSRILQWHILFFQLLACWGFGRYLVWELPFQLKVLSTVFWTLNFTNIFFLLLEVYISHESLSSGNDSGSDQKHTFKQIITDEVLFGFLFRLLGRYFILVYQTIYLMWAFMEINDPVQDSVKLHSQGDHMFWWWQYVWLSLISMIPYLLDLFVQFVPYASTIFLSVQNEYGKVFLNILFPSSRNYVGKIVHEKFKYSLVYTSIWFLLIVCKLLFSYKFEVTPLIETSIFLYDDLMNFPEVTFAKTFLLLVGRWIPFILVFLVDMPIFYALGSGLIGGLYGMNLSLGKIRAFKDIKDEFLGIPTEFHKKLLPKLKHRINNLSSSTVAGLTSRFSSNNKLSSLKGSVDTQRSIEDTGESNAATFTNRHDNEDIDITTDNEIFAFATTWNLIVNQLREEDLISNSEKNNLVFDSFTDDSRKIDMINEFKKVMYLPCFQTAIHCKRALGKAQTFVNKYRTDRGSDRDDRIDDKEILAKFIISLKRNNTTIEAIQETFELILYILRAVLKPEDRKHVEYWEEMIQRDIASGKFLQFSFDLKNIDKLLNSFGNLLKTLKRLLPKRKDNPVYKGALNAAYPQTTHKKEPKKIANPQTMSSAFGSGGMRKSLSMHSFLDLQNPQLQVINENRSSSSPPTSSDPDKKNADPLTSQTPQTPDPDGDRIISDLRTVLNDIRNGYCDKPSRGEEERMENGEFRDGIHSKIAQISKALNTDPKDWTQHFDKLATVDNIFKIMDKLLGLLSSQEVDVQGLEAKRRLVFFMNSLFMDMPKCPKIKDMTSWTVMTPYYSEDVILSKKDLDETNTEMISTRLYLQTLYKTDWLNFLERTKKTTTTDPYDQEDYGDKKHTKRIRQWASRRAQTLFRTVTGMMLNEEALRTLATFEDMNAEEFENTIPLKFGYVVTAQIYGRMKREKDPKAKDIEDLLHDYPLLRVAYIDQQDIHWDDGTTTSTFYSVLIKSQPTVDGKEKVIKEIYRIRLPGNPVLGEGKPENQNHAIIFTRGELLQTIDMNQDGYLEEAFKMRNLMERFQDTEPGSLPTSIVGFREHIFTGSVSSLANYMALQELSFVTLGQRVLTSPLCIRLHYGHPDVFDKLFFIPRGGVSKASKTINLSEDIFAGYSNLLRGGSVAFEEFVQCGKGRDVGFQQIYKFEAKLSQGAAEQSLSRDVNRITHRLDFFRLLSFYYGGIGHYISSFLTILAIYCVVYLNLYLAIFEAESLGDRKNTPLGTLSIILAGIGIIQTFPLFFMLWVEKGFFNALVEIIKVFGTGGPLYFLFHIRTRAYYFMQTIIVGKAEYKATGRGFVIKHTKFADNFRFFASSHIYLGFEIACALTLVGFYSTMEQYWGRTWSLWLASLSFLWSPFWFNPVTFEWKKVCEDYEEWYKWMMAKGTGTANLSWKTWWSKETSYMKELGYCSKLIVAIKSVIYFFVGVGLIYVPLFVEGNVAKHRAKFYTFLFFTCSAALLSFIYHSVPASKKRRYFASMRLIKIAMIILLLIWGVYTLCKNPDDFKYVFAFYYFSSACAMFLTIFVRTEAHSFAHFLHDFILGHLIFVPLFFFAALQIPNKIQTWLLYQNALASGVAIDDILKYARRDRERVKTTTTSNSTNKLNYDALKEQFEKLKLEMKDIKDRGIRPESQGYEAISSPEKPARKSHIVKKSPEKMKQQKSNEEFKFIAPTKFPDK